MKHLKSFKQLNESSEDGTWVVFSGLGGGFGGASEKGIWIGSKDDAEKESYYQATSDYDSYDGSGGLRTTDEIMEEDEVDEDEAQQIWNEEREGWLDYYVEPYNSNTHESNPDDKSTHLN